MATTWQNFLKSLIAHGGIVTGVEKVKDCYPFRLTDKGKIAAQCTEENDVHAGAGFPRILSAAVSEILVNIPIRTSGNTPAEGDDDTLHGC